MNHRHRALVHFNRAAKYYQKAIYVQAVHHYLAGLRIDATRAEIHADLAKAYEMLGCWDRALKSLETALRLQPGYPPALRRKQRILEEQEVYAARQNQLDLNHEPPFQYHQMGRDNPEGESSTGTITAIEHSCFTLTCPNTTTQRTVSVLCQLVERIYHEVGEMFQCYPHYPIPVSIEDTSLPSYSALNSTLPAWAAARYNGGIQLIYRPGNTGFGILSTLICHEWVHLTVDLLAKGQCPRWLDEGLAQTIARPLMNFEHEYLLNARRNQKLLTMDVLRSPFHQLDSEQRRLAYLQSSAIVEYLIKQFGISLIRELLNRIGKRKSSDIAIQETLGKMPDEIVTSWQLDNDGTRRETQSNPRRENPFV